VEKYIELKVGDGSVWRVPANIVADHRADYFGKQAGDVARKAEYEYTIGCHAELIDWASNNMNWRDVEKYAFMVSSPKKIDMQEQWVNGRKTIGIRGRENAVVRSDYATNATVWGAAVHLIACACWFMASGLCVSDVRLYMMPVERVKPNHRPHPWLILRCLERSSECTTSYVESRQCTFSRLPSTSPDSPSRCRCPTRSKRPRIA